MSRPSESVPAGVLQGRVLTGVRQIELRRLLTPQRGRDDRDHEDCDRNESAGPLGAPRMLSASDSGRRAIDRGSITAKNVDGRVDEDHNHASARMMPCTARIVMRQHRGYERCPDLAGRRSRRPHAADNTREQDAADCQCGTAFGKACRR
jgi:hypothetical protein